MISMEKIRNIPLDKACASVKTEELFLKYEELMTVPDPKEREKQAACIIQQLKEYYRAKGWNVYSHDSGMRLLLHKPADLYTTEVWADAEYGLIHLKIQIPIIVEGESRFDFMARALHNFNQDSESGVGSFILDDGNGRIDYIYRYSFEDGCFTEERFRNIQKNCMKAARLYYSAILNLAK